VSELDEEVKVTKRIAKVCIAMLLMATVSVVVQAQDKKPAVASVITLQQAIDIALAKNRGVAIAREQFNRSRAQVKEARASGLPQLRGQAQSQTIGPSTSVTLGSPGQEQTINIGTGTSTTASVALTQVLDANGRVSLATSIQGLNSHIQQLNLARSEQQLVFDVQNAYYSVLRAEGQRDVSKAAIEASQERLRIARAQLEAGALPKFDVTRAEVEVANQEQTLISATAAVDINKAVLRNIMGVDPTEQFEVDPVTVTATPLSATMEQSVSAALAQRPEVRTAEAAVELQKRSVSFARRERIPALAATATYNYDSMTSLFSPNKFSWMVGVGATFPVFTSGAISARINEAKSDLAASQDALEQAKLDVELDVKSAMVNLNDAYQRIQTAEQNVRQAEEALNLSQVRYQSGISLQVEVTDAESALTLARTNFVNARYDYATALARYQRATATQPQLGGPTNQPVAEVKR
jgi:outer membrane protein